MKEFLEQQTEELKCKLSSGQVSEEQEWYIKFLIDCNQIDLINL